MKEDAPMREKINSVTEIIALRLSIYALALRIMFLRLKLSYAG
jgi:hypothetical protein